MKMQIITYMVPGIALTCNNVVKKSCGHAENPNKKVTDGEVEDEKVGDSAHVFAPQHNEAHHSISDHTDQENEKVGHYKDCCY